MQLSITEQLQYVTVRIEVELKNGGIATGTGFFFKLCEKGDLHIPVVVTNKHVVEGGRIGKFKIRIANDDGSPNDSSNLDVFIEDLESKFIFHPNTAIDLAVLPIAPLLKEAEKRGKKLFYIPLDKRLIPSEQDETELTAV